MLIWISAHSAAIGYIAVLLLLVASPSKSIYLPEENATVPIIRNLPFANSIANPCSPGTSRSGEGNRTQAQKHYYSMAFYKYMASYGIIYKQDALKAINQSTIDDCGLLYLPILPNTPTRMELQETTPEDALKNVLSSLLVHSAHAYFVDYQLAISHVYCQERQLAQAAIVLARKLKHMACLTQLTIHQLGYSSQDIDSILDQEFVNLSLCSRRALRDCQILLSIVHLLDVISGYSETILQSIRTS